jgi:hypothetical protein
MRSRIIRTSLIDVWWITTASALHGFPPWLATVSAAAVPWLQATFVKT